MKTLIATALVLATLNSFAASVKVYEGDAYDQIDASYGINEEMGRAWVELAIYTGSTGDDSGPSYDRVHVEGLSLAGGSVVLNVDGQQVECAKVKPSGIFRTHVARATKNCKFVSKIERRTTDDGFE
ncbi:MAG: hypothetical protein ACJ76H_13280, partial [Bacteriovoracaceae bacterium]